MWCGAIFVVLFLCCVLLLLACCENCSPVASGFELLVARYLANDMLFYCLIPFILYAYSKRRSVGLALIGAIVLGKISLAFRVHTQLTPHHTTTSAQSTHAAAYKSSTVWFCVPENVICVFALSEQYNIGVSNMGSKDYGLYLYPRPWTRCAPCFIGVALGTHVVQWCNLVVSVYVLLLCNLGLHS